MIVSGLGQIAPKSAHDHEMAVAPARVAHTEVHSAHGGLSGPRLPDLVPFWKPPNISDRMISTTISTIAATIAATIPPTLGMRGMVFLALCAVGWLRSFTSH